VCESILEWALAHPGCEIQRLIPAARVHKSAPRTIESTLADKFSGPLEYPIPEKYLARLPGARLVGDEGLVVLPDGRFAAEAIYGADHLSEAPSFQQPLSPRETWRAGNYYSLLIKYALDGNYYHWLHDVILRLYGVVERLPPDTRYIAPPGLRPFQYETLALVGITPEQLCEFDGSDVWRLENLYFSPPTVVSGGDSPAADAWLRDLALTKYHIALGPARRRIYVSRRAARHRRIVNEPEVESFLAGRDFEIHHPERYEFRDQVALFAEAEVVVGAHGAGHTNMFFAPRGLIMIDIVEASGANKCFWNMSSALGHDYWYICGDMVKNPTSYAEDLRVSVAKLATVLDRALPCGRPE